MALFLSRYDNKVDKKGRISVPSSFRAQLASQSFQGVVAYPSPINQAIECCGIDRMEQLAAGIDSFNPFSEQFSDFATSILTRAHQLPFDGEGRIILPDGLLKHAGIEAVGAFTGRGPVFQIWNPDVYEAFEAQAAERARDQAAQLSLAVRKGELPS